MFAPAQKKKSRLRLALIGPAGSGKTFTALQLAAGLGKRIAVIDTERGSASLYSDRVAFDVAELASFSPLAYCEAIAAADRAGYDVLVIDSLSHAWSGKDGALEMVDRAAKRSTSGNSFSAWREVTPAHNRLVDTILGCRAHVIATMRTKTEYVIEEDHRGKKVPKKVGLAPIQREGLDYEFTLVGDLNLDHVLTVTKTRCEAVDGAVIERPGRALADTLLAWLDSGAEVASAAPSAPVEVAARPSHIIDAAAVAPPAPERDDDSPEPPDLRQAILAAATLADLEALIPSLQALPPVERTALRPIYNERRAVVVSQ